MRRSTTSNVVPSDSGSLARMDGIGLMVPVLVDAKVAGPGPCIEPSLGDGFLDLRTLSYEPTQCVMRLAGSY